MYPSKIDGHNQGIFEKYSISKINLSASIRATSLYVNIYTFLGEQLAQIFWQKIFAWPWYFPACSNLLGQNHWDCNHTSPQYVCIDTVTIIHIKKKRILEYGFEQELQCSK